MECLDAGFGIHWNALMLHLVCMEWLDDEFGMCGMLPAFGLLDVAIRMYPVLMLPPDIISIPSMLYIPVIKKRDMRAVIFKQ